jgi:hypothetical protein
VVEQQAIEAAQHTPQQDVKRGLKNSLTTMNKTGRSAKIHLQFTNGSVSGLRQKAAQRRGHREITAISTVAPVKTNPPMNSFGHDYLVEFKGRALSSETNSGHATYRRHK